MHPSDADRRIQNIVAQYLGQPLDQALKQQVVGAIFTALWDAELDDDEVFFRAIGGLLVQVWNGRRDDGPDWVKQQPSDTFSSSPPIK